MQDGRDLSFDSYRDGSTDTDGEWATTGGETDGADECVVAYDSAVPGETYGYIRGDWTRVADAHYDDRSVSAYVQVGCSGYIYLGTSDLLNQCGQPDASTGFSLKVPEEYCGQPDSTPVRIRIHTDGLIVNDVEGCPGSVSLGSSGAVCSTTLGELETTLPQIRVELLSDYLNFGVGGGNPVCPNAGESWPDCAPECPVPEPLQQVVVAEGTTADEVGTLRGLATGAVGIAFHGISRIHLVGVECGATGVDCTNLYGAKDTFKHADNVVARYKMVLTNGRTFVGSLANLARVARAAGQNVTPQQLAAMAAATRGAGAGLSALQATGSSSARAVSVANGARGAATLARGGLWGVLIAEVGFLGWEVYDIGSSAATACENGASFGEFLGETCSAYGHYTDSSKWCW